MFPPEFVRDHPDKCNSSGRSTWRISRRSNPISDTWWPARNTRPVTCWTASSAPRWSSAAPAIPWTQPRAARGVIEGAGGWHRRRRVQAGGRRQPRLPAPDAGRCQRPLPGIPEAPSHVGEWGIGRGRTVILPWLVFDGSTQDTPAMRQTTTIWIWIFSGTILVLLGVSTAQAQNVQETAKRAFGSTVLLVMEDANGQTLSLGSGFFVRDGVIACNLHVIEGAASGYAKLVGQKTKHKVEGVTALDPERDLDRSPCHRCCGGPISKAISATRDGMVRVTQRRTVGQLGKVP